MHDERTARALSPITLVMALAAPGLTTVAAGALRAQSSAVVPAIAATLPGNAAMSMPLRWSHGSLQVLIGAQLLPANFIGQQIRGLRLRRPSFLGEPPYAAVQRTLVVRAGFTAQLPQNMNPDRTSNVPASAVVVAGPTVFQVGASVPPVGADPLGDEFLVIPFPTPLPVTAGTLFLEFEALDAPLTLAEPWVDAVWFEGGVDRGYAATVGDGSCTLGPNPLELQWTGDAAPLRGADAVLRLRGLPPAAPTGPGALALAWVGVEPVSRPIGLDYLGFGGAVGAVAPALAGCFQWAPFDVVFQGQSDVAGSFEVRFAVPPAVTTVGMQLGVQGAWFDPARPGAVPLSLSNGVVLVLDSAAVGNRCSSLFFPGAATFSPWGPQRGLMPVLVLDY